MLFKKEPGDQRLEGRPNIVGEFLMILSLVWKGKQVGYGQNSKIFTLTFSSVGYSLQRGYVPLGTKLKTLRYLMAWKPPEEVPENPGATCTDRALESEA